MDLNETNQSSDNFSWVGLVFSLIQVKKASADLAPVYFSDPSTPFWNQSMVGYPLIPFCWQTVLWIVQSTSAILATELKNKYQLNFLPSKP